MPEGGGDPYFQKFDGTWFEFKGRHGVPYRVYKNKDIDLHCLLRAMPADESKQVIDHMTFFAKGVTIDFDRFKCDIFCHMKTKLSVSFVGLMPENVSGTFTANGVKTTYDPEHVLIEYGEWSYLAKFDKGHDKLHGPEHEMSGENDPLYGFPHVDFRFVKYPDDADKDAMGIMINGDVESPETFVVKG